MYSPFPCSRYLLSACYIEGIRIFLLSECLKEANLYLCNALQLNSMNVFEAPWQRKVKGARSPKPAQWVKGSVGFIHYSLYGSFSLAAGIRGGKWIQVSWTPTGDLTDQFLLAFVHPSMPSASSRGIVGQTLGVGAQHGDTMEMPGSWRRSDDILDLSVGHKVEVG